MDISNPLHDFIRLQERDIAILRGLFESRIMTAGHIAVLYFDGKKEAAKKRLQKLKATGFIGERRRKAFEPAILFLTRKSFAILQERGVLLEYPPLNGIMLDKRTRVSELTLRHELEVMDVKAVFYSALIKSEPFTLAEFSTWPLLNQFEARRSGPSHEQVLVKPDSFIRVHENESDDSVSEHTFFLEVDRSSETLDTLTNRAGCYIDYYKSGGFAVRNGAKPYDFKDYPFRVLMVFKTAERRNNIAECLLQNRPPIFTQVYLSTYEEVMANPLGAIWIRPIDYREAQKEGALEDRARMKSYRRQSAREKTVEKLINKIPLIE